jgi:hypothetical protein
MAAPATSNIHNLSGVWTMNKVESDPTDPILSLARLPITIGM